MQVMHQNATSLEKLALTFFSLYNLQGNARVYMLRKLLQSKATPSNTNNGFLQQWLDAIKVCCIVQTPLIWFLLTASQSTQLLAVCSKLLP